MPACRRPSSMPKAKRATPPRDRSRRRASNKSGKSSYVFARPERVRDERSKAPSMTIRPATAADAEAMWQIFKAVVAGGDTYVFAPDTPRQEALDYLLGANMQS